MEHVKDNEKEHSQQLISTTLTEAASLTLPYAIKPSLTKHTSEPDETSSHFISYDAAFPASPGHHCFFSPPSAFCTRPPIAPSALKFLPIAPSLESGPPTFSPTLPMAPSLVKAPPMAPFASNAAGAFWSVGFWPLGREGVSMIEMGCLS